MGILGEDNLKLSGEKRPNQYKPTQHGMKYGKYSPKIVVFGWMSGTYLRNNTRTYQ